MTTTAHLLTGAVIAAKVSNPWLGLPLAFITHFFEDFIPHWDLGFGYKKRKNLYNFILWGSELIIASLFTLFLFYSKTRPFYLLSSMIISISPDILELPYIFKIKILGPWFNCIVRLQSFFHRKASLIPGLLTQIILVTALVLWALAT